MEIDDPWENPIRLSPYYISGMEYWDCKYCKHKKKFLFISYCSINSYPRYDENHCSKWDM